MTAGTYSAASQLVPRSLIPQLPPAGNARVMKEQANLFDADYVDELLVI